MHRDWEMETGERDGHMHRDWEMETGERGIRTVEQWRCRGEKDEGRERGKCLCNGNVVSFVTVSCLHSQTF